MRVLLIAYDFPPIASPQSLRWAYLCPQLVAAGIDVHVLAPDIRVFPPGLPPIPADVEVHRSCPGGLTAWIDRHRRQPAAPEPVSGLDSGAPLPAVGMTGRDTPPADIRTGLNWKGRIHQLARRLLDQIVFPDSRGEWLSPAMAELDGLLHRLQPDLMIASHEPAVSLMLAANAGRANGIPWLADLGDPVLAPYTPWQWRGRARRLEARVCREAAHVLVTTRATRDLLCQRHGIGADRIGVLGQGFDGSHACPVPDAAMIDERLHLLYTGRFYRFRNPRRLFEAVLATDGVVLSIACPELAPDLRRMADRHPESFRLLGALPHDRIAALQRRHDVLVSLGNDDPRQTPGKIYEYFGAGRPILHIEAARNDPVSSELLQLRRGWVERGDKDVLAGRLADLRDRKAAGRLESGLALDRDAVRAWDWRNLGAELAQLCRRLAGHGQTDGQPRRQD